MLRVLAELIIVIAIFAAGIHYFNLPKFSDGQCIQDKELESWADDFSRQSEVFRVLKVGRHKYLLNQFCGFNCTTSTERSIKDIDENYFLIECPSFLTSESGK